MAAPHKISKKDLEKIRETDCKLVNWYDPKKDGGPFKVGDVYIEEYRDTWNLGSNKTWHTNKTSRGAARKFLVIHVSKPGYGYMKEINSKGKATGMLRLPHRLETILHFGTDDPTKFTYSWSFHDQSNSHRWVLDPEVLDSILLEQEFDPAAEAKERNALFNEITEHNKRHNLREKYGNVENWLRHAKVGDVFWSSPDSCYTIQKMTSELLYKWRGDVSVEVFVEVLDKNKNVKTFSANQLHYRRTYSAKPRSYTRETKQ